jgi:WD40 repeat protein
LRTLTGHGDRVSSVVFSHDSALIVSASYDKTVRVWESCSGKCLQILTGHDDRVTLVVLGHDSALFASTSEDGTIKIWKTSDGGCMHTLEGHLDRVTSVVFSHDSALIATSSYDKTVKIWDASSGRCIHILQAEILDLPPLRILDLAHITHSSTSIGATRTDPDYWFQSAKSPSLGRPCIELDPDNTWIIYNGEHTVWLPMEYRPGSYHRTRWTVSGKSIAIATEGGSIWMCQFQDLNSEASLDQESLV